jgi:hypothetical protein
MVEQYRNGKILSDDNPLPCNSGTAVNTQAFSTVSAGATVDLGYARGTHTMQTKSTGTPATVSITLQGSLDGSTWATLATSTSTTGDMQQAVDKPVRYLRANLGTLTGGTTPTVTAMFCSQ